MWLDCGKFGRVPLDRVGQGIVVAKDAHEVPPGMVELIVCVDGEVQRHIVRLITGFRRRRLAKFSFDDGTPF
jgi:hypothetical protein